MELRLNLSKLEVPKSKLSKSLSSKSLSLSARESPPQNDQAVLNDSPKNVKVKMKKLKKNESMKYPSSKNAPQNPFLQRIKAQLFSMSENQNISTHDAAQPSSGSIQEIKEQKQQIQKSHSSEQLAKIVSAKQLDGIQKSKFALGGLKKSGIMSKRSKK